MITALARDEEGRLTLVGNTTSSDFATTEGAFSQTYKGAGNLDAFVAQLSPDGAELLMGTYLSGSRRDYATDVALDSSGDLYVTGHTYSTDFPTTPSSHDTSHNGGPDSWLVRLSADGKTVAFGTFFGGSAEEKHERVALDGLGYVCLAGETTSSNFPTTPNAYGKTFQGGSDVFAAKFNQNTGALLCCSLIGGGDGDVLGAFAVDRAGNMIVTGTSGSGTYPRTPDAFRYSTGPGVLAIGLAIFDPRAENLIYATTFGDTGTSLTWDIALDAQANLYMAGATTDGGFFTTPGAYSRTRTCLGPGSGGDAVIVMKWGSGLDPNGPIENQTTGWRFGSIGTAISSARPGDVVVVEPGVYAESVALDKDLVLQSADPNDPVCVGGTVIQGNLNEPVATLDHNGPACEIAGLTLRAGSVGVLGTATAATIRHCRIMDNATHGVELSEGSHPYLLGCLIAANGQTGMTMHPHGTRFVTHCEPTIENCTIVDNQQAGVVGGQPLVIDSLIQE